MKRRIPKMVSHGPLVEHNQSCAVFWAAETAVYDVNRKIFQPSWAAQEQGWVLVQVRGRVRNWILRRLEVQP